MRRQSGESESILIVGIHRFGNLVSTKAGSWSLQVKSEYQSPHTIRPQ
jgi:hypothetical protein